MTRLWTGASIALLTLAAAPLVAQDRDSTRERERERPRDRNLIIERRPLRTGAAEFSLNRPRIGVMVSMAETDAGGARVESVTDDGPADKAGLRAGDIITRFGDTRLEGEAAGRQLVELAQKLEPGDTVKIEYTRDGSRSTATVVAEDLPGGFVFTMPRMEELAPAMERLRSQVQLFGSVLGGVRLQEVSPELGEYFGVSEGVLVLEAPVDSTLPLRAGDVILAIDGRKVQSASHAQRILTSYAEGETVSFNIMRKRQRQTLEWTAPERRGGVYHFRGVEPTRVRPRVQGS